MNMFQLINLFILITSIKFFMRVTITIPVTVVVVFVVVNKSIRTYFDIT